MKKILALTLALMLALSLAACGGKDGPKPSSSSDTGDTPPASAQQEQQPSSTPDPGTEQTDSESTSPDESMPTGDTMTVAEFLQVYGLSEDDCKPEHFIEFGEPKREGNMGILDISVDKEHTTEETMIAWYTQLYTKLESLSDTGKLYADMQCAQELTGLDALIEGTPNREELPAFSCFYPYPLPEGRGVLTVNAGYNKDTGTYNVMIVVMGYIR